MRQDLSAGDPARDDRSAVAELRQSIFLLALMASSMGAYLAIGALAVRLLSSR